ncbi:MAG: suppressor of fused domain protein [Planctomycetaceae bacterium]
MGQDLIPYKKQAIHGILDGNAEAAADAFKKNPDLVSDKNAGYQPWICHAVPKGNKVVVEAVIAAGCNINATADNGCDSAITSAITHGHFDLVPLLLERGCDPNLARGILAAIQGDTRKLEMTKLLVEAGARINEPYTLYGDPDDLFTALEFAEPFPEVSEYLRSKGAKTIADLRAEGKIPMPKGQKAKPAGPSKKASVPEQAISWFSEHMGPVQEAALTEIVPSDLPITIHVIPASEDRPFVTLFTSGMSAKRMKTPRRSESYQFAELFIQLPKGWKYTDLNDPYWNWPITWLRKIARHPHENRTWLGGEVTIIADADPPRPFANGIPFTSMLLMAEFSTMTSKGEHLRFYRLIPLFTEERDLEIKQGLAPLMNAFDRESTPFIVDVHRKNVAVK